MVLIDSTSEQIAGFWVRMTAGFFAAPNFNVKNGQRVLSHRVAVTLSLRDAVEGNPVLQAGSMRVTLAENSIDTSEEKQWEQELRLLKADSKGNRIYSDALEEKCRIDAHIMDCFFDGQDDSKRKKAPWKCFNCDATLGSEKKLLEHVTKRHDERDCIEVIEHELQMPPD